MNKKIKEFRKEICSLTSAIASEIITIMKKHPGQTASFVELTSSPILLDNAEDDMVVTLDSVKYHPETNTLTLFGSNSQGNDYSYTVYPDGDASSWPDPYILTEVLEYLLNNEQLMFNEY